MELRIEPVTIPEVINFNFEDLKAEIIEKTADYAVLAYNDDQIKEAKADRAKLNKFSKALNDERIKVKNACLAPYEDFERKVKELDGIVKKAITNIDEQVKGFEQAQKDEKKEIIEEYFSGIEKPDWLVISQIFDQKWLNASARMDAVKAAILSIVAKINDDIGVLGELPEYSFEVIEEYKRTLNLTAAIAEGKRLAEIQKRKAEAEARRAEEEARRAEEARIRAEQKEKAQQMRTEAEEAPAISPDPVREWVSFKALLSREEALSLAKFFRDNNIRFMSI